MKAPIAISVGEPAGIGPDIVIQWAQKEHTPAVVFADPDMLIQRAKRLNFPLMLVEDLSQPSTKAQHLTIVPAKAHRVVTPGQLNPDNAAYVLECLQQATDYCVLGNASALVTAPLHKGNINAAGIEFTGHTEWLQQYTHSDHVVMMLANEKLRVALVTTHCPLKTVASSITKNSLSKTIEVLFESLGAQFHITNPCVGVCGLNPHAGESGYLGQEEITVITPVIKSFQARDFDLRGPYPADTIFAPDQRTQFDAILAMYHDQGLAPFKALSFGEGVNITLGLPIVRTSVDHGTALELAATGKAKHESFSAAVEMAMQLSNAK